MPPQRGREAECLFSKGHRLLGKHSGDFGLVPLSFCPNGHEEAITCVEGPYALLPNPDPDPENGPHRGRHVPHQKDGNEDNQASSSPRRMQG